MTLYPLLILVPIYRDGNLSAEGAALPKAAEIPGHAATEYVALLQTQDRQTTRSRISRGETVGSVQDDVGDVPGYAGDPQPAAEDEENLITAYNTQYPTKAQIRNYSYLTGVTIIQFL